MTETTLQAPSLPAIPRPDGRLYRPRKLAAEYVSDHNEEIVGVVIFGTFDHESVHARAEREAHWLVDRSVTVRFDRCVWWRDAMDSGHRTFITDEKRGRAACVFTIIDAEPAGTGGSS